MTDKEVILSGLRSNAEFHLGNYLGAIKPIVDLQKTHAGKYQINLFIPDLHSFTTPVDHSKLYEQTIRNIKLFVASGLNIGIPDTYIYRQSYIPAHSELTWILSCFTSYGELLRMTAFKEKSGGVHQSSEPAGPVTEPKVTAGLFNYPVLMAADILLYGAKWIPVGDDQRQHVEFTRNLAIRMNNKLGNIFVVPEDNAKQQEFAGHSSPVRIRSLRNPENKMSKSVEDPAGTIMLSDKPEDAVQKIMSATTDSLGSINYDFEKQPGVSNLLLILDLLSNSGSDSVAGRWRGKSNYGELKQTVAEHVSKFLGEVQSKISSVDEQQLLDKLTVNEAKMNKVANQTLGKIQQAVGLRTNNN